MHEINANILQKSFISLILFLFFNASLIEKYKVLEIKIKVLNFINNIISCHYHIFLLNEMLHLFFQYKDQIFKINL